MMRCMVAAWLALLLLGGTVGCGSAPVAPPPEAGTGSGGAVPSRNFGFGQA